MVLVSCLLWARLSFLLTVLTVSWDAFFGCIFCDTTDWVVSWEGNAQDARALRASWQVESSKIDLPKKQGWLQPWREGSSMRVSFLPASWQCVNSCLLRVAWTFFVVGFRALSLSLSLSLSLCVSLCFYQGLHLSISFCLDSFVFLSFPRCSSSAV